MGYTTDFTGSFKLDKPLAFAHRLYLKTFNETRRMKRDAARAENLPDPIRAAVSLPIGEEGGYFVGGGGFMGQDRDDSVVDHNFQPKGQPGLWCKWTPNEAGDAIEWDLAEKFYDYVEWLEYIVGHFLAPWGYRLSGEVTWQGEDAEDFGVIVANGAAVTAIEGKRSIPRESAQGGEGDRVALISRLEGIRRSELERFDTEALAKAVEALWPGDGK